MHTLPDVPPTPAPPARVVFHDIDAQAACLAGYEQRYQQLGRGRFRGSFETQAVGVGVTLHIEEINQALVQRGRTPDASCSVGLLLASAGRSSFGGTPIDLDSLVLFPAATVFDACLGAGSRFCVVDMPGDTLAWAIEAEGAAGADKRASPLRGRDGAAVVRQPGRGRLAGLRQLIDAATAPCGGVAAVHRAAALADALVEQSLALAGSGPTQATPLRLTAWQRHRIFCRARDHLEAHAAEPLSIGALCRTLGVSRRLLEYCFAASVGESPASYLRTLRLNGVRRELQGLKGEPERIGDIAARWGFWHPSRMAAQYRALFGELPSQTVVRG